MNPALPTTPRAPARTLQDQLDAIDRAESTGARVQVAADLLHEMGFDRVVISLRDASLNPTIIAQAGSTESASLTGLGIKPLPGAVWRRRLPHLERFRVGDLHLLDGSDPWVAREFFGGDPSPATGADHWLPTDLIVGVLRSSRQEVIGLVKLAGARDGRRPGEARRRDLSAMLRHLAARVAYDALEALARQRHERLQLLQEAGASLTRSLDEQEIMRELARQVQRAVRGDGVAVLVPDLHNDILSTALRVVRGVERTRGPVRLGEGLVAEVARTGRPVRVGDREADRARERAGLTPPLSVYDIVGESGAATSVLAVPMRVGIRLIAVLAVHSSDADIYTAEDEEVLATMASQAATAIANARRYAESERERRTTEALADVARAVGESLRLGEVLRLILRHSMSLLGVEGACIALRTGDYLHIVAAIGSADVLSGVHLPVNASLIGRAVLDNELIVLNEFGTDSALNKTVQHLARIQRTVIAPLVTGRGTIGGIAVINRDRPFDQEDAKVLQRLADQVAVAIVNARLFEEIERATREWKVAFDSTASGMVVLEEALTVSRCNTRAAELCGTTIPNLLGRKFRDALVGSGDTPEGLAVDECIARARSAGSPVRETVRDLTTGRLLSLLVATHPDGGCVITFDDVTEASRLAEQHRTVLDTVSDAIVITGLDGRISFANPAALALFQRESLVGTRSDELVAPDWTAVVEHREMAVRRGESQQYECDVLRADGVLCRVEVGSAPLVELGEIIGSVACLRDVTAQRADALARERSEALYTRLVESATDAIFTVDTEGRFTSVNAGFLREAGVTREQVLGHHFLSLVDHADRAEAQQVMTATLAGGRHRAQVRCIGLTGSRLTMVTSAPIHESGVVVGALGIVRDITNDEIQRETRVQQARLAAVGQSLGRVANELNNPLTALLAVAELQAASPTLQDDDRRAVEQMLEQARRASRIVNQLLDSSDDAATMGGHAVVDANAVMRRALEVHGYGLRALSVELEVDLASGAMPVQGDALQLQQALSNLITNAEQALAEREGVRQLKVSTRRVGSEVRIAVQDNGPGILPNHLARILEPMYTTRSSRGHRGLGLTISHTIIKEHGGSLDVESVPGAGATFTMRLPFAMQASTITPSSMAAVADPADDAKPGCTLLIVEDEGTLRAAMARYLRGQGYAVDTAESGAVALEMIAERPYDLLLLDLRMAGMSGEEVFTHLAAHNAAAADRVLFITGDLHSEDASRFIRQSGRPVLAKPFTLADLSGRVAQLTTGQD
jgi:PAS domain S-box-containing protein